MTLISRCFASTIAAAILIAPLLPAQAKSVTTPILTLKDTNATPMDFHLVSQNITPYGLSYTTIQFDGLGQMSGNIVSPAGTGLIHQEMSKAQSFDLLIDPHYAPVSASFGVDVTYHVASGSSWSGSSLDVQAGVGYNGYSPGGNHLTISIQGDGTRSIGDYRLFGYAYDPAWYSPTQNHQSLLLQINAIMEAGSTPWSDGKSSFSIDNVTMTFGTQQISPVPEPDAVLLMLAGLAVVGAAVKRRSKSGPSA
ncbi:PEP-CTERM sorting domain-containing protein [Rugamonas sp. A1-17]|nr:PEP-CTERM sorting domain-containing protein [Rugamonas sp. A1-17]